MSWLCLWSKTASLVTVASGFAFMDVSNDEYDEVLYTYQQFVVHASLLMMQHDGRQNLTHDINRLEMIRPVTGMFWPARM